MTRPKHLRLPRRAKAAPRNDAVYIFKTHRTH